MITPRLQAIKKYINKPTAADIGTDHAYIPIELIRDNICEKVIATDVNEGPLNIARENIKKAGYSEKIETRLGDGISVLEQDEADQIIIAGMGGFLICNLLATNPDIPGSSQLILQPMNCQYELRKYLIQNGYSIIKEDLAKEGFKIYNIIIAQKGKQAPFEKEIYYHIPNTLSDHPLISYLIEKKLREFNKILNGQKKSSCPDDKIIEKYNNLINEIKKEYKK